MSKSVLIVDDEAASREALARLLEGHGFQVRTAADAQDATREMAAAAADTVLLDIDLPHVPGDSLAAFLHLRYPKSRLIFMSGYYDMINPERFGENALYFRKPLDMAALVEAIGDANAAAL